MSEQAALVLTPSPVQSPWRCCRCAHQWFGRTPYAPKRCPNCQSRNWHKPVSFDLPSPCPQARHTPPSAAFSEQSSPQAEGKTPSL